LNEIRRIVFFSCSFLSFISFILQSVIGTMSILNKRTPQQQQREEQEKEQQQQPTRTNIFNLQPQNLTQSQNWANTRTRTIPATYKMASKIPEIVIEIYVVTSQSPT
jgi:heme exporter protein D